MDKGMTLVELVIGISILGIIAMTSFPFVVDLLSSASTTQNKAGLNSIGREALETFSSEVRQAIDSPAELRPWVSGDGSIIRFYRRMVTSDSIRYYFASNGEGIFLFRSVGTDAAQYVPSWAGNEVEFINGSFSVDDGATGYSVDGKVHIVLQSGKDVGIGPERSEYSMSVYCRNFR